MLQRRAAALEGSDSSKRQLVGGVGLGLGLSIASLGAAYLTTTVPELGVPNNDVHDRLLRYGVASLVVAAVLIGTVLLKPDYRPRIRARSIAYVLLGYLVGGPVGAFIVAPVISLLGK
jgi:hypothetical protein